jgi:transcription elongation factor Elf1
VSQSRIMALEAFIMEDKKFRCPRCRREKIVDQETMIRCMVCDLEFDKSDLERFEEEDILSISEKRGIVRVLLDEFLNDD